MKEILKEVIEERAQELKRMAKEIWDNPELGYEEFFASKVQRDYMEKNGFVIREVSNLPTAFIAEYGEEGPVVGVLGEYDALPGFSQLEGVTFKAATESENPNGHGCGHNLLGVAGIGACLAIKEVIDRGAVRCRIRYYGCPAEELLTGKARMEEEGVFKDLDLALSYHPFDKNAVWAMKTPAMIRANFNFKGTEAHAGYNPEDGRSALDAVELMNVGSNYLREHMSRTSRIHYTITDGGKAPNIVPGVALSSYHIRSESKESVEALYARVVKVARGAAMMTETEVEIDFIGKIYDYEPSNVLTGVAKENLKFAGEILLTDNEKNYARELSATIDPKMTERARKAIGLEGEEVFSTREVLIEVDPVGGATDVGNVSYIAPTIIISTACMPAGVSPHSWQATASFGSELGLKGMIHGSKAMAGTIWDVCTDPELLERVIKDHNEKALK
jgi:aminobenzoyl-glutamate utilization protein B